jgi:beta-xylosidase
MSSSSSKILNPSSAAGGLRGAYPWTPDQGDGTFRNPIIHADYSDPDVIRHGDDFFLVASSLNCTPGLPILHSRDLVNWTIINHAVRNLPHERFTEVQHGCGVWAPAIRFHAGKFWIFFPMPDEGIYVTTATDPAGQWSEPHLVQAGRGLIDPCPLWDDGKAYLVHAYAHSRTGIKHVLRVRPMAPDGSRLLGEGRIVFNKPDRHPTLEGPKFLKKDGWYYILAPAGGVETGWQVALRSRKIYGPYRDKVVLEQGGTSINGPHQGALVDLPNGEWWFVHFQDAGAYGRIIHLQPVVWQGGWPLMGVDQDHNGIGEPVLRHAKPALPKSPVAVPQTGDEFDSSRLGLQWQWHANFQEKWFSLAARPGWLRLIAMPMPAQAINLTSVPHRLTQKFPAAEFTATTRLDFSKLAIGEKAGLVITGMDYSLLAVERTASGCQLARAACQNALGAGREKTEATVVCPSNSVWLRVKIVFPGKCDFSHSFDGKKFSPLGKSFTARKSIWTGSKVGLFCLARAGARKTGHADFDWFRFE